MIDIKVNLEDLLDGNSLELGMVEVDEPIALYLGEVEGDKVVYLGEGEHEEFAVRVGYIDKEAYEKIKQFKLQ